MIYAFAGCELDTGLYELRRAGSEVHVEPQVFGVLAYLVEHRDRVVSKAELLDEIWGDRFVSESALTSRIKAARRAVGDDGRDQQVIRTVHGRGYRFVAPVTSAAGASSPSAAGGLVRLLERDHALGILDAALEDAAAGCGRVAVVPGEPGIGKTSLVRIFTARARARARILAGGCDDLITPRPFGPFHDLTTTRTDLAGALEAGAQPTQVQRLMLDELDLPPRPVVLVIEDVHWADGATLDLVTLLARRISGVHGLMILTFRDTELGDDHPLVSVVGSVPPAVARHVALQPLSLAAVTDLVGEARAGAVMAATQGNPFYVTELAATAAGAMPPSVRDAVLARVAHLPEPTRELLALIAVAPARLELAVLDAVRAAWSDSIVAAERAGIVVLREGWVQFRHELARWAVHDALPEGRRRRLHLDLLHALVDRHADPARIVHHAAAAGDDEALARHALLAARQAAAASAHREAHSQYRRALRFAERLPLGERARVHEEASLEAYLNAQETAALDDAEAALDELGQLGDLLGCGRLHRWLSRLHWFAGRGAQAGEAAQRAVEVLEPLGPSTELAWAYSNLSQLAMLAWDDEAAVQWGHRAVPLAERLGEEPVRVHALVNLGLMEVSGDLDHTRTLLDAIAVADAAGEHHEATRGLLGVAFAAMLANRLPSARELGARALRYGERHEVLALTHYVEAMLARMDVLTGRWDGVEERLRAVIARDGTMGRLLALSSLGLLQVRRGDAAAQATLAQAWAYAEPTDELQRLIPLAVAQAEHAWLAGQLDPSTPHLQSCYQRARRSRPALTGELVRWLHQAGCPPPDVPASIDDPYRLELAGRWTAAATAWEERQMPYDQALCLAWSGKHPSRALAIADGLGATPLARWIRRGDAART